MVRMDPRRGENDLVRSRSHRGRDHLSCLIQSLRGKPTRAVEAHRIAPASLFGLKPRLARFLDHRLARRAVQEDFGDWMRHASKLARAQWKRRRKGASERPKNGAPTPVIGASYYVRVNTKEGVAASTVGGRHPSVRTRKARRGWQD